jgi:hemoglobin-like flavoprotein
MKTSNFILSMIQGQIGKKIVVKHYGKKVVVTKAPDMSNIKPSPQQKVQRSRFAEAVAYAKHINNTPELRAAYVKKAKKSKSVYQYVLKEYLKHGGPPK